MANAKAKDEVPVGKEVVSIQDRIKNRLANVNNSTSAPASNKVSTNNSVFTLPDGKTSEGPLNCIVLDYMNMNTFYPGAYDANNIQPPACHAVGRDIATLAPPADLATKCADACNGCSNNEFGSAGRGKACKNQMALAILPHDYTADSELLTIKVSPTGIKTWSGYVRMLAEQGLDPIQVVTSISFRQGVSYPTLVFRHIGGNDRLEDVAPFLPEADSVLNAVTS